MSTRKPEDFSNEIASHIEQEALRLMERGVPQVQAWAEARRTFGNTTTAVERFYEASRWVWLDAFWRDVRQSARNLWRSPAFSAIAILSLALGIGVNTAAFSLVDAVLLKTLPVRDPEQLRVINFLRTDEAPIRSHSGFNYKDDSGRFRGSSFSYNGFLALQKAPELESVVGFAGTVLSVVVGESTDSANGQFVSGNFFQGLGVTALRGRALEPSDEQPGAPAVAVVTYRFWERRMGLDPNAIGKTVSMNRIPVAIVGILPAGFQGLVVGGAQEVFLPLAQFPRYDKQTDLSANFRWWVMAFGRVKPGVSDAAVEGSLSNALAAQTETYAPGKRATGIVVSPGAYGVNSFFRRTNMRYVWALTATASLILLICCVNLANLLLSRSAHRGREIAVRLSIGASRWGVVRHLLTESALLAVTGGLLGVVIARPVLAVLMRFLAGQETLSLDARVDERALLFAFGVSLATALLFGTLPALRASRVDVYPTLKDGSAGGRNTARTPISRILVVTQVALSMLMLIGAGLLTRTFVRLMSTDLGFKTDHLLTFQVDPTRSGYEGPRARQVLATLRQQFESLPGVSSVALSHLGLIQGSSTTSDDLYIPDAAKPGNAWMLFCSDSFLSTMKIPLLAGRDLEPGDTTGAEMVAVVNETFVKHNLQGQYPLGKLFYDGPGPNGGRPDSPPIRIVGVVRDAHYTGIRDEVPPTVYMPYLQQPRLRQMTFIVGTPADPDSLVAPVRAAVASVDRALPVTQMQSQQETIAQSVSREQILAMLASGFGILAAALAAIGLYGVMAYTVSRRTSEFGIRMALGATRVNVQWLTLRGSLWMVGIGLILGIGAGLALMKFLQSFLYQVEPTDAVSFAGAAALMVIAGALAAWLPARRASNVDPLSALRHE